MNKKKQDLTREEKLELENQALDALLQYGVKFTIPLRLQPVSAPRLIQFWNRHFSTHAIRWRDRRIPKDWNVTIVGVKDIDTDEDVPTYMRNFHLKPLYLGTIDMIQKIKLDIDFDEKRISENASVESEKLLNNIPTMAKIVAVALLNCSDAADPLNDKVPELQRFMMSHLTVGRLQKLSLIIDQMRNKAGFVNSIRLIFQQEDLTAPKADRIE